MCSNTGISISRSNNLRFSFLPSTRPDGVRNTISLPSSVSFRVGRPGRAINLVKSTLNDTFPLSLENSSSFYDLLGIPETGSLTEIKRAYKQLARKYHPDVSPPGRVKEYTQRFIRVQEAYETLSDPGRRALYDLDMANGLHLAFSARRYSNVDEEIEEKCKWRSQWQSQLSELKRRSAYKNSTDNTSWAARVRKQRNESS